MEEAVEKTLDELVKGDPESEFHRKMSNESAWARGKSMLKRKETMKVLQRRATDHHTRKATQRRSKKIKEPLETIQDVPIEPNSLELESDPEKPHVAIQRTKSKKDPENLDEREC